MLKVQAFQQHRLAVMAPNKAKPFPAATLPAVEKLGHRRRGKRGTRSEERRKTRRERASKQKSRRWRSRGVVGVPYPTRRKNQGKNLGRKHPELSKKRRVFARKMQMPWRFFSGATFVLFCFVFCRYAFVEAAAFRSIVLRYAGVPIATRVFLFVCFCRFFRVFVFVLFLLSLFVWRVRRTSFPSGWYFFYLMTTGWIFDISLC